MNICVRQPETILSETGRSMQFRNRLLNGGNSSQNDCWFLRQLIFEAKGFSQCATNSADKLFARRIQDCGISKNHDVGRHVFVLLRSFCVEAGIPQPGFGAVFRVQLRGRKVTCEKCGEDREEGYAFQRIPRLGRHRVEMLVRNSRNSYDSRSTARRFVI